ncbi:MAG TPA: Gfo/Idh/MocA family oxidoreductase [Kineosporiaceae bacterium]|nr:Gfo/Idh/MocA family oxidoreductase [Kineosporiaceae bacterium]
MRDGSLTRPVHVGVVGAGAAGRQHLAALRGCHDVVVAGVCDPDPSRLSAALAEPTGPGSAPPRGYSGLAEMLADERIELIAIATPPGSHAELATEVLAAQRSVLLEKPPLLSVDDLERVVADADARGLVAGVMLQHRFRLPRPAVTATWSAAAVGILEVIRYRPVEHYQRDGWRSDATNSGGGLIAHLGVHYLDLACQVLGTPAEIVGTMDGVPGMDLDQRVAFCARFPAGQVLTFIGTTAVDRRSERLAIYDTGRELVVDEQVTRDSDSPGELFAAAPTSALRTQVYLDLAHALRSGRRPEVADLQASIGVVRMMELVRDLDRQVQTR